MVIFTSSLPCGTCQPSKNAENLQYETRLTFGASNSKTAVLVFHVLYRIKLKTKKKLFQNFSFTNSQQLILNNIYLLFYLNLFNKNMISLQQIISFMFSYFEIIIKHR